MARPSSRWTLAGTIGVAALALSTGAFSSVRATADVSPVADAAMRSDRTAVRTLLTGGEDVNGAQGDGMTALHWAARHDDVDLIRMLLSAGANVRAATRLGSYTPLLMASQQGNAGAIEALLAGGADVKGTTASGTTPLMLASAAGQAQALNVLLAKGADVNAAEPVRGETALMFAVANRRIEAARILLAAGASVNAATKVVSLKAQPPSPEEEAYLAAQAAAGRGRGDGAQPEVPAAGTGRRGGGAGVGGRGGDGRGGTAGIAGVTRQYTLGELIGGEGGLTPLLFAARQGTFDGAKILLDAGANVDLVSGGDGTSPLLMAVVNGHFDLAALLLERGAKPFVASENGATPLYAVLNVQWAPRTMYPQPQDYTQQKISYLELMTRLIDKGADVNARLKKKVWYSEYNFPLSGIDEIGATPFWRAAYASDVDAMRLLVARGADPNIPTVKPAGRPRTGDAAGRETIDDKSGLPPVPVGGPGLPPLLAAAGAGFGEGFAANSHQMAPSGWMPAVRYLVEELKADVNARDHEGNTALHDAASRGDNDMIRYLVSKGADVKAVNRAGETTADMANSPVQRTEPYPETVALLEQLGAKNNHHCKSCGSD